MKKRKGFTLIEILIVVVIIGILIGTGMTLNRWSLEKLRAKSAAEEVSSFFDTTFLQIQASNYQNGKSYSWIDLKLEKDAAVVPYVYHLNTKSISEEGWSTIEWSFGWEFTITAITWENHWTQSALESLTIKYLPFAPNCEFEGQPEISRVYFSVKPRGLKNACFQLDKNYCKLKTILCEEDRNVF